MKVCLLLPAYNESKTIGQIIQESSESEFLIKAGKLGFRIESLPIQTRYGDEVNHIKPLREMWLFTRLLLRSL